jgi:hypothetical protein
MIRVGGVMNKLLVRAFGFQLDLVCSKEAK